MRLLKARLTPNEASNTALLCPWDSRRHLEEFLLSLAGKTVSVG